MVIKIIRKPQESPKIPESPIAEKAIALRWDEIHPLRRAEFLRMHARLERTYGSKEAAQRLLRIADKINEDQKSQSSI